MLLAIGYVTKSLAEYPRRIFITWAVVTPVALIAVTLFMQEIMRRFLMNAFDKRKRHHRRLQQQQPGTRTAPPDQSRHALGSVSGFFDDRSPDRLGMETGSQAGRLLERPVAAT